MTSKSLADRVPFRPLYCVWEITLACNLRCGHCGSRAGTARADELSTDQALDVVNQLADLGCRLITLSGGEPTLRKDWDLLAREGIARGIAMNMVTNGMTMSRAMAVRAREAGLCNVAVSLDGTAALHEEVRGAGTFARVERALANLRAEGMPIAVLTHLNRKSMAELEDIHDLVATMGAQSWRVQLGKPMGNLEGEEEHLLVPRDLRALIPRLVEIKRRSSMHVDVGDSIGYFGPHESFLRAKQWGGMRTTWSGCQAGRFAIGIESDGGVKGCLSLQAGLQGCDDRDPFREGSLRDERLDAIWFRPGVFAFNREQKTEDLEGFCRTCKHAAACRGGAKCVAAAFTGRTVEDPFCSHRVETIAQRGRLFPKLIRDSAAAALMGLGVGAAAMAGNGCVFVHISEPGDDAGARDAGTRDAGDTPAVDAGGVIDSGDVCADVCCDCDYGILPAEIAEECCGYPPQDAGVAPTPDAGDVCAEVCCECEYGVLPPEIAEECCGYPPQDAGVAPTPDAGDPCQDVCCDCDYGVLPPEGCCE